MNWFASIFRRVSEPLAPSRKTWTRPPSRPLRKDFHETSSCVIEEKKIAIARFRGLAANTHEDAHVFAAMDDAILKLLDSERPQGLILDFSELEYSWGDEMLRTFSVPAGWSSDSFPIVVITSELNREGLTSLVRDEMFNEQPSEWLADSEAAARLLMASKIKKKEA